jgi:hypothetical protein
VRVCVCGLSIYIVIMYVIYPVPVNRVINTLNIAAD